MGALAFWTFHCINSETETQAKLRLAKERLNEDERSRAELKAGIECQREHLRALIEQANDRPMETARELANIYGWAKILCAMKLSLGMMRILRDVAQSDYPSTWALARPNKFESRSVYNSMSPEARHRYIHKYDQVDCSIAGGRQEELPESRIEVSSDIHDLADSMLFVVISSEADNYISLTINEKEINFLYLHGTLSESNNATQENNVGVEIAQDLRPDVTTLVYAVISSPKFPSIRSST